METKNNPASAEIADTREMEETKKIIGELYGIIQDHMEPPNVSFSEAARRIRAYFQAHELLYTKVRDDAYRFGLTIDCRWRRLENLMRSRSSSGET